MVAFERRLICEFFDPEVRLEDFSKILLEIFLACYLSLS